MSIPRDFSSNNTFTCITVSILSHNVKQFNKADILRLHIHISEKTDGSIHICMYINVYTECFGAGGISEQKMILRVKINGKCGIKSQILNFEFKNSLTEYTCT